MRCSRSTRSPAAAAITFAANPSRRALAMELFAAATPLVFGVLFIAGGLGLV